MRRTRTQRTVSSKEARQKCRFLLVETHICLTSIVVLTVHVETSLLYTFQRSVQAHRSINLWEEKAPIYGLSRRKAPKSQQICHYRHATKTIGLFLLYDTSVGFNFRNNFANLGFFAELLQFTIPYISMMKNQLVKCTNKMVARQLAIFITSYETA